MKWIQDYNNGLRVQKIVGDYKLDLQFTPIDYVLLQREMNGTNSSEHETGEKAALEGFQYYILTVSALPEGKDFINHNIDSQSDKQKKLYYFSFLFQQDIQLEEGENLLPCVLYHFERSADVNGSRKVVLGFENPAKEAKEARLVITSDEFGSLPIKIKISKNNIPTLKI